jgi:hypothetical protein
LKKEAGLREQGGASLMYIINGQSHDDGADQRLSRAFFSRSLADRFAMKDTPLQIDIGATRTTDF